MLNMLNKSSFDISLLFKLKYAAILLLSYIVNKGEVICVIMTHFACMNTQK